VNFGETEQQRETNFRAELQKLKNKKKLEKDVYKDSAEMSKTDHIRSMGSDVIFKPQGHYYKRP
jgi:ribosomal protein L19E